MNHKTWNMKQNASFTLVELLIVIGILAILTAAVVIVLNPAELLKQSRDSTRMSDLASLDNAIQNLQTQVDISLGTASTVYLSIPDTSSTCSTLGLPALPAGYTYHCVATTTLQNINGTGWLPIDFTLSSIQSLSALPIDPTNTTSSGLYYTYIPGGSYEFTASLESSKYKLGGGADKVATDGGDTSYTYEKGTNLSLNPVSDTGLVGYWKFDEGLGTTTKDSSGNNNTGTLYNSPTWQTEGSCRAGKCLSFDGSNDYVSIPDSNYLDFGTNSFTISFWSNQRQTSPGGCYVNKKGAWTTVNGWGYDVVDNYDYFHFGNSTNPTINGLITAAQNLNRWLYIVTVANRQTNQGITYINGVAGSIVDISTTGSMTNTDEMRVARNYGNSYTQVSVDDIRIYNRALSAAEVMAIYNATK